jgi:hypothetical protein
VGAREGFPHAFCYPRALLENVNWIFCPTHKSLSVVLFLGCYSLKLMRCHFKGFFVGTDDGNLSFMLAACDAKLNIE